MDEIEALQRMLASAQLSQSKHKLSERNTIDVLLKLIHNNRIDIIHTNNGREYITPKQLKLECEKYIKYANGRISLIQLSDECQVSIHHIQHAVTAITNKSNVQLINGMRMLSQAHLLIIRIHLRACI